jgi:two-component system, LuxR family, sensor kinase FixL
MRLADIYSTGNRARFLLAGGLLIGAIGLLDFLTPDVPVGFLYVFPILLIAGFVSRWELAVIAAICAGLTALFSDYPMKEALSFLMMAWIALLGTGLFASEIVRGRQQALEYEDQLRALVETSPLAILTIDANGQIILANDSAQDLLAPGDAALSGQRITDYLPLLDSLTGRGSRAFRTELRCRGKRKNGETFVAAIWVSSAATAKGRIISAILVDLSETLRDREGEGLQFLLANAKILMAAMAHEVRNLCGAARLTYSKLSQLPDLQRDDDFRALGTVIKGLESLAAIELQPGDAEHPAFVDLASVLDEFRVIIESSYRECGMEVAWSLPEDRPLVRAERYGLLQVFLNLARNSQQAMQTTSCKRLTVGRSVGEGSVIIRFEDTGSGIAHPETLFRPFQNRATSIGLGLYICRAILKNFGAEIACEPRSSGSCFAITLQTVSAQELTE